MAAWSPRGLHRVSHEDRTQSLAQHCTPSTFNTGPDLDAQLSSEMVAEATTMSSGLELGIFLGSGTGGQSRKVPDLVAKARRHHKLPTDDFGPSHSGPTLGLPTVVMPPYLTSKGLQQPETPGQANPKVPKLSSSIKCSDLVRLLPEES